MNEVSCSRPSHRQLKHPAATRMLTKRVMPLRSLRISHLLVLVLAIRLERSACWSCTKQFLPTNHLPVGHGRHCVHRAQRRLDQTTLFQVAPASSVSCSEGSIYDCPELYDLAFGYRDFESEVEFLLKVHRLASSSSGSEDDRGAKASDESLSPFSVLELAAGPAQHALTALRYADYGVAHATAVDISPSMADYALQLLEEDLDEGDDDDFDYETSKADMKSRFKYVVGDMRNFKADHTFDTAWILLGSMQHLLTANDAIACFQSAYVALKPGGTLIVELPHPQEVLGVVECTRNEWTVPLDGLDDDESTKKIVIVWGDEDDPLDPVTQVRDFTVGFQLHGCEEQEWSRLGLASPKLQQVVPMRLYTAGEVEALARCSGFRLAGMYGALEPDDLVDINDEELAFRMVCVLQKV